MPGEEPPKLIIDTDWKSQAQAEKERLSAAPKAGTSGKPGAGSGAGGGLAGVPSAQRAAVAAAPVGEAEDEGETGIPREVSFKDVLSVMISQALAYMGAYPDPRTGQAMVALDLAKLHIDMLGVLETKTKGNLSDEESTLLTRALSELRLEYVDVAKMVAKAVQEGRASPMGAGGPMSGPAMGPGMGPGMGGSGMGGPGGSKMAMPPNLRNPG